MASISFETLNEMLRTADIENLIATGSPANEYEGEAEILARAFSVLDDEEFNAENLFDILAYVWADSFELEDEDIEKREAVLQDFVNLILSSCQPADI